MYLGLTCSTMRFYNQGLIYNLGAQITDPGTLTVGEMATIQCNTSLTNIRIEWLLNDEVVDVNTAGATELDLVLNPVNQNFNGRVYTCRVTVAGGDTISDMFTVMTQREYYPLHNI